MFTFERQLNKALGIEEQQVGREFRDLQQTLLPLQHGWTEEEVINGMMPDILKHARMYSFTPGVDMDDLIQQGAMGVLKAMQTDKGIANFASHAKNYIKSFMRPGGTSFTGTQTSIKDPAVSGVSIDKPVGGEEGEMTLGATLRGGGPDVSKIMANKELLAAIMDKAGLTDVEKKIIELSYGVGGEEEEAIRTAEDIEQAPARPVVKRMRGPVAQKKGKFARRTGAGGQEIRGTKEIADMLGVSKQAVNAARNRALLKLMRAAADIAPGEFEEIPAALEDIKKFFRVRIIEAIVDGSINGVITG